MTMATARTQWSSKAPAGLSGLTRTLLRQLFIEQRVASGGVVIGGVAVRITFHALLADKEALNAMLYLKGASGTVPCAALCSVANKPCWTDVESGIAGLAQRSDLLVDISCSDVDRIGCRTDEDVWAFADLVAAAVGRPAELKRQQQLKGMNYHPQALLFDVPLRAHFKPATHIRVDPMHILFASGFMGSECMLLFQDIID